MATCDSMCWEKINNNSNDRASLQNTDSVLRWTPLQYVIKSKNWSIVERLLQSNVDRASFDIIGQRAQDPHYIHPITIHAAT